MRAGEAFFGLILAAVKHRSPMALPSPEDRRLKSYLANFARAPAKVGGFVELKNCLANVRWAVTFSKNCSGRTRSTTVRKASIRTRMLSRSPSCTRRQMRGLYRTLIESAYSKTTLTPRYLSKTPKITGYDVQPPYRVTPMLISGRHISKLSGYAPALPTTFDEEGNVDAPAARQHICGFRSVGAACYLQRRRRRSCLKIRDGSKFDFIRAI
jgi:hypothetical protein